MHRNHTRHARLLLAALAATVVVAAAPARPALAAEGEHGSGATHDGLHQGQESHAGSAATGIPHGKAEAEKIHNWFGFAEREHYPPIGWALVNFAILLFLLFKFAGPSFRKYLGERHEQAKAALAEAARLRAEAQRRLAEIERRVRNLDGEIAQIKKDVAEDAEREKTAIIAAAQAEAERIIANADRTMGEELKRARAELEVEAVQAAMAAAEQLLRRQVNDADHARLHKEYLVQLRPGGGL